MLEIAGVKQVRLRKNYDGSKFDLLVESGDITKTVTTENTYHDITKTPVELQLQLVNGSTITFKS